VTRDYAKHILDAVRAGSNDFSIFEITAALQATGDIAGNDRLPSRPQPARVLEPRAWPWYATPTGQAAEVVS